MAEPTVLVDLSVRNLDVELREPFGIASGVQPTARNLVVRARLADGSVGYGEAAPFPAVNGETREAARSALVDVANALRGVDARAWRLVGARAREAAGHARSACCAVETAVLDALTRHYGVPLRVFFGGAESGLITDCTITTGTPEAASAAAARIAGDGFAVIKLKVGGGELAADVARVLAVRAAAPGCGLLLDANGGMRSVDEAVELVRTVEGSGGRVVLFEQPMGRDDWDGMAEVTARLRVPVAADESVSSARDVAEVAKRRAASAVNLKIMKSGVAEALEMAATARTNGLGLMVGGMVETSLAMGMSASIAAGIGGFQWVDLDTPLFMVEEPMEGEFVQRGPRIELAGVRAGHGVWPRTAGEAGGGEWESV